VCLVYRVRPVRIKESRRDGAIGIGKRKILADGPFPPAHHVVQAATGRFERLTRLRDSKWIAIGFAPKPIQHDFLHWRHYVIVEEAIHHSDVERRARILGKESDTVGMMNAAMLDDDARVQNGLSLVDQNRKALQRPEGGQFLLRRDRRRRRRRLWRRVP